MNEDGLIVKQCFTCCSDQNNCSLLTMNVQQRYIRLFPSLLGNARISLSKHSNKSSSNFQQDSDSVEQKTNPTLKTNPYYHKYAEKINKLKQTNYKEFEKRMKLLSERNEQSVAHVTDSGDGNRSGGNLEKNLSAAQHSNERTGKKKSLDSILKLELINDLPPEKISALWIDHYSQKDAVCAVIPKDNFHILQTTAQTFPLFVYPIPRKDGYEMFVGQFESSDFHFTSLLNYQRHQENAPAQLILNHYTELLETKGIVLMSGMVTDEHISVTDAQLLTYLVQYFHTEHPTLLRDFNRSPNNFDFQSIITAMDSGLAARASVSAQS